MVMRNGHVTTVKLYVLNNHLDLLDETMAVMEKTENTSLISFSERKLKKQHFPQSVFEAI